MSTETGTAEAPSWLNDRDWLDGKTEIELSSRHLRAYWAPDATAKLVSVTLPSVTIRQGTR